jgi:hypothetical protein
MTSRRGTLLEHGSSFHLCLPTTPAPTWVPAGARWFGTARDALRAIVRQGRRRGWTRLHVPTYYCHEVTRALRKEIEIALYEDGPLDPPGCLHLSGDEAVIAVDYLGEPNHLQVQGGTLIVDATHDPLLSRSGARPADLVVASLRKTLPFPDGALVWSETATPVPDERETTGEHGRAVADLLAGMALKAAYVGGASVEKGPYLALLRSGEAKLGVGAGISGVSVLTRQLAPSVDVRMWREQKQSNRNAFEGAWGPGSGGVRLLPHRAFAVLETPNRAHREALRQRLISLDIYPAVLWPLSEKQIPSRHRHLAAAVLMLHLDARYTAEQVAGIAARVSEVAGEVGVGHAG